MKLEFLSGQSHPHYQAALSLYCRAFPEEERREPANALCPHGDFRPGLLTQDDRLLGILFFWENPEFIYLEHFAMMPQLRGQGLGAGALALLQAMGKPIILEIEPPVDELTCRRKGFYRRNGFQECPWPHIQPKYRPTDAELSLALLSWPQGIHQELWQSFEAYLAQNVAARS